MDYERDAPLEEGDIVIIPKSKRFTAAIDTSNIHETAERILKREKEYEVLWCLKEHPLRGADKPLCRQCIFVDFCSFGVVVLRGLEEYGFCSGIFDKVERKND